MWFMSYVILIDNDYQSVLFVLSHIVISIIKQDIYHLKKELLFTSLYGSGGRRAGGAAGGGRPVERDSS